MKYDGKTAGVENGARCKQCKHRRLYASRFKVITPHCQDEFFISFIATEDTNYRRSLFLKSAFFSTGVTARSATVQSDPAASNAPLLAFQTLATRSFSTSI